MVTRPRIFKWRQTEPQLILCAVRWYLRYSLSLRDVEELLEERGLEADHTTVWRRAQRYGPELEQRMLRHLKQTNKSWRCGETYVKVKGHCVACDFFVAVAARFRILIYTCCARDRIQTSGSLQPDRISDGWMGASVTPGSASTDGDCKFLLHDRHKTFSASLDEEVESRGIHVLRSPVRIPTANAHCERLIGSIRRECLDYVIPLHALHLQRVLREWVRH